jgi:hypothetical protein
MRACDPAGLMVKGRLDYDADIHFERYAQRDAAQHRRQNKSYQTQQLPKHNRLLKMNRQLVQLDRIPCFCS